MDALEFLYYYLEYTFVMFLNDDGVGKNYLRFHVPHTDHAQKRLKTLHFLDLFAFHF